MSERRDAYVEKLKARLDKWNKQIDVLETKAREIGTESKAEVQKHIDNVKSTRADLEEKIDGLRKASDSAWKDLKKGVKASWKSLDKAVRAAAADLKQSPPEKSEG